MLPYLKIAPLKKDVTNKIKIGSIGSIYFTPMIGPVMAKKYPTNINNVVTVIGCSDEVVLNIPSRASMVNIIDMIVPTNKIERYRNPLLFFM